MRLPDRLARWWRAQLYDLRKPPPAMTPERVPWAARMVVRWQVITLALIVVVVLVWLFLEIA